MQFKRLIATARSSVRWLRSKWALEVPAKKFLLSLCSLALALVIASTACAQTTIPQANITEDGGAIEHAEVVIKVPNVTCYGRFHDSLKEHLQDKHDWIHSVRVGNTGKVRKRGNASRATQGIVSVGKADELPFDIGTIAELTFSIDSSRTALDLLKAIRETKQYSLKDWKVQVEVSIEEMLAQ